MRSYSKLTRVVICTIPLFSIGVWLESANALGNPGRSGIGSSHLGRSNSHVGPRLPTIRGITSQSKVPQVPHKTLKGPRGRSTLKRRFFKSPQAPFLSPFFYPPVTPESSDTITTHLPEDDHIHEPLHEETPKPPEAPHPLVIELRCGKYVRIPWPESSILYSEEGQEDRCSDSK